MEQTEITKGMSGDKKYKCTGKDGKTYLLRISEHDQYDSKKKDYGILQQMNDAKLPVPECISFEKKDDGIYQLLSWVDGTELEKILSTLGRKQQYEIGIQAGKILARIHEAAQVDAENQDWYDRYFEVIGPRLEAYRNEGENFKEASIILKYIEQNKHLLRGRKQCFLHGDYHMGNLILRENEVYVIDWQTVDFDNYGDPWYEFNRLGVEYPSFASGQIYGYFNGSVPDDFWKLFALYISTSAITSIVWAKHYAPSELEYILQLNRDVVMWFDKFTCLRPNWYIEGD
ncbi:MAG: aminoglycoside phosphotransferase family protein [Hominenteromicrobium sp.]